MARRLRGWSRTDLVTGQTVGPCGARFLWRIRCLLWTGHDGDHQWYRERLGTSVSLKWRIGPAAGKE